ALAEHCQDFPLQQCGRMPFIGSLRRKLHIRIELKCTICRIDASPKQSQSLGVPPPRLMQPALDGIVRSFKTQGSQPKNCEMVTARKIDGALRQPCCRVEVGEHGPAA